MLPVENKWLLTSIFIEVLFHDLSLNESFMYRFGWGLLYFNIPIPVLNTVENEQIITL